MNRNVKCKCELGSGSRRHLRQGGGLVTLVTREVLSVAYANCNTYTEIVTEFLLFIPLEVNSSKVSFLFGAVR